MAFVATHDHSGLNGKCQGQILVVFRVKAVPDVFYRLNLVGCYNHQLENVKPVADGGKAVELRAKQHFSILVLNRLRHEQAVRTINDVQKSLLRNAT